MTPDVESLLAAAALFVDQRGEGRQDTEMVGRLAAALRAAETRADYFSQELSEIQAEVFRALADTGEERIRTRAAETRADRLEAGVLALQSDVLNDGRASGFVPMVWVAARLRALRGAADTGEEGER